MSKKPFDKFINKELKGAKKKEVIRQQKRKLKDEARKRGEEFRKKEAEKYQAVGTKYGNTPDQRGTKPAAADSAKGRLIKTKGAPGQRPTPTGPGQRSTDHDQRSTDTGQPPASSYQRPAIEMPLNKFIAHAGICGRREAAELVKQGKVTVNGDIIFEPGHKVMGNEDIKVSGKKVFSQKNLVYILLNKPKDYLTTLKDPEGRKTVMDLVKAASRERIYPVGRLDRNTTGVLLLTNDGELAQKLTHPSFEVKKIYEVTLDRPVAKKDVDTILNGITLEDGFVKPDAISYADAKSKAIVGIEIHSGKNRIVRRIFEHMGYDVKNLDRVMFGNLTKKNVDRGKWRHLNEKEVRLLKFMNQSFIRAKKEKDAREDKAVEEIMKTERVSKPRPRPAKDVMPRPSTRTRDDKPPARKRLQKDGKPAKGQSPRTRDEKPSARKRVYKDDKPAKRQSPRKR
ncbi:MAG: pseudouridine synthase [Chitinophagaceae bacterium]|nr:pseudouridine synthase [Chitinophagaceae bacterium]